MLKIYNTLEEVPEALREHYVKSDGKYVPQLSDDHPVLVHNKTLLTEKANATNKVRELEADIAAASEKTIPRGHVAVAKADAELIDKYKAHGTPDEVAAKVAEHKSLSDEVTKTRRDQSLRQLAKDLGFNEEAFVRLPGLPEFERREKDGKPDWMAKVKGEKDVVTERPAKEFIESSADIAPFMAALQKTSDGVKLPVTTGSTTQSATGDPFASAKAFGEDWNKSRAQGTNVAERFGLVKQPAATA
jgi:hypothetical protein